MKKLLPLLLLTASLASCKHDADSAGPDPGTLAGSWRLTDLTCFCPAAPLPNETLTLEANQHFTVLRDGKVDAAGTYAFSTGATCGGTGSAPLLVFTNTATSLLLSPATYKLNNGTLVVDHGGPCDAPVKTYRRVQ